MLERNLRKFCGVHCSVQCRCGKPNRQDFENLGVSSARILSNWFETKREWDKIVVFTNYEKLENKSINTI
jgi:hypothetical protein